MQVAGMTAVGPSVRLGIVDSDPSTRQELVKRLERVGWSYRVLGSAVPIDALLAMRLDAVVIDVESLGAQGWAYLEALCGGIPHLGVVVCTGRSSVGQRVRGLRLGADDWVTKPCHPEELVARVEAVVRRRIHAGEADSPARITAGHIELVSNQFQAFAGGVSLDLTRREFELLHLLAAAGGQVLRRESIYQRVWGYTMVPGDRSVDVFVRKLRQKLERGSPGWRYIHTHFGVGYRFSPEAHGPAVPIADPPTGADV